MPKKSSLKPLFLIPIILGFGAVVYYATRSETVSTPVAPSQTLSTSVSPPLVAQSGVFPRTPPTGQKEYQNATYHVSFFYPEAFMVREQKMPGTALTIFFTHKQDATQHFQLFIMPYAESRITPERLKTDIPSGVAKDFQDIVIDGVGGVMFVGKDAKLGATREVWFIHHGFLYEFTSAQALDPFLQSILETWRFFPEESRS